jgi:hypothetical protein
MNDYYYYTLITPFIPKNKRAIVTKRDLHLIILKSKKHRVLNSYIYIHVGSPCFRYCICKYFTNEEVVSIYEEEYPRIV